MQSKDERQRSTLGGAELDRGLRQQKVPMGRSHIWFRRLTWLLLGVIALYLTAIAMDWPHLWIGPAFSFVCAEITRRICAEANPNVPLRWRDIFRFALGPTRGYLSEASGSDRGRQRR